jgi:hypothetical protein
VAFDGGDDRRGLGQFLSWLSLKALPVGTAYAA